MAFPSMSNTLTLDVDSSGMKVGDIIEFYWTGEEGDWTEYCKVIQVEGYAVSVVRNVDPTEVAWKSLLESE